MSAVYAKAAIACILMLLAALISQSGKDRVAAEGLSFRTIAVLAISVHLTLFLLIYVVMDIPVSSDVPAYYYPQAVAASAGEIWN